MSLTRAQGKGSEPQFPHLDTGGRRPGPSPCTCGIVLRGPDSAAPSLDRGTAARAANASTGAHLSPFLCFSLKEPPDRTPTALSSVPMVSLPRPPRVTQNPGVAEEDGGT